MAKFNQLTSCPLKG